MQAADKARTAIDLTMLFMSLTFYKN
jgi:hypothetical protein